MPDLLAGTLIREADTPPTQFATDDTTVDPAGTGLGGWVSISPEVSVTFTAPTTGRVEVTVGAGMRTTDIAGDGLWRVSCAPEVRETDASGAVVLTAGTVNRWQSSIQARFTEYGFRATLLTGLTPGATYFARVMNNAFPNAAEYAVIERSIHVVAVP